MNKILVTGSSGYIGQHLVKMLQKHEVTVHGLDIVENHNNVDMLYHTDIRANNLPNDHFDTVIHLAALVNVGESVNKPYGYYDTNLNGTKNILENLNYNNFIFASTGAAEKCESPYGTSKRAAEDIVKHYCKDKDYTIFRFYNVVGSDGIKPTNPDGLMWNLINATKTNSFTVFGNNYNTKDGTCVRDYVHVNEICNSIIKAISLPAKQIENLGHGVGITVKEMIDIFKKVNNCNFDVKYGPRRSGDIEISVLDNPSLYLEKLYSIEQLLTIQY